MITSVPSTNRSYRRRIGLGLSAAALVAVVAISGNNSAPAQEPQYSTDFVGSVSRYAELHGLSGLSPASMGQQTQPTDSCRGLSPVSAQDCSAEDIERAFGR